MEDYRRWEGNTKRNRCPCDELGRVCSGSVNLGIIINVPQLGRGRALRSV